VFFLILKKEPSAIFNPPCRDTAEFSGTPVYSIGKNLHNVFSQKRYVNSSLDGRYQSP
jgi:hypothetical protein